MSNQKLDIFGQELLLDDCVVYPYHNSMRVGKVTKINPKMVQVTEVIKAGKYGPSSSLKYPHELAKVTGPEVTMYLLKING